MSQAGTLGSTSGPIPPTVVTQFTTDDNTTTPGVQGHVIPVANNVNVFGSSTIEATDSGIETVADPNNGDTLLVTLTNRSEDVNVTIGATTVKFVVYTPSADTATTFKMLVTGYDSVSTAAAIGGEQLGLCIKTGVTPSVVGLNDTFDESSAILDLADWNVIVDPAFPNSLSIELVGVAGTEIHWRTLFEYITQGLGS